MIGAYVIRKLDDANKIPPSILKNKLLINIYKNNDMLVDHLNCHKIDIIYNLEGSIKEEKEWLFIINQIIHSFSYIYIFDNYNKFDGFLINSDKTKKRSIYYFPLKILLYMFLTVSEEC